MSTRNLRLSPSLAVSRTLQIFNEIMEAIDRFSYGRENAADYTPEQQEEEASRLRVKTYTICYPKAVKVKNRKGIETIVSYRITIWHDMHGGLNRPQEFILNAKAFRNSGNLDVATLKFDFKRISFPNLKVNKNGTFDIGAKQGVILH